MASGTRFAGKVITEMVSMDATDAVSCHTGWKKGAQMPVSDVERRVFEQWSSRGLAELLLLRKIHTDVEGPSTLPASLLEWPSIGLLHRRWARQEELPCRGYIAYTRVGLETWVLNPFRIDCPFVRAGFVCTRTHLYAVDRPLCGESGETTHLMREVTCEKCQRMDME